MKNQSKYFKKTLSAFSLVAILSIGAPLAVAQDPSDIQPTKEQTVQAEQQVVNLNDSTFEQLVTLKGVGQTKAQAIIAYRQQIGSFKSINELSKVRGIGEKIISDNKARLAI